MMEALEADVTKGVARDSLVTCVDSIGARELKIISVAGYSGTKNRHPKAGTRDEMTVSVTKGTPKMRCQVLEAAIVRQRKSIRRSDDARVEFEDSAVVIIDEMEEPRGTEIKGPVTREIIERSGSIAPTAMMIV